MVIKEYFTDKELSCRCGCGAMPDPEAVEFLYALRILYEKPIKVRSAARCRMHNKEEGGKENSEHITDDIREGNAFDIVVPPVDEVLVLNLILMVGFVGIGIKNNDFMHIDRRITPAFWTYA